MKQLYIILLLPCLISPACTSSSDNYELIAQEACNCMQPLSGLYTSLKEAMDNNDLEALDRLAKEIEQANESVDQCAEQLEEKYGEIEGAKGEGVKLAMKKICPKIIQIMNDVEQELVQ
jgi:division protein CdvB (Snf7/Vps24/ESCRT-III family)